MTTFVYYGGGTETDLIERSGQAVTVVRRLAVPVEADEEVGPMFKVRFSDGQERDVFSDELRGEVK